MLLLIFSVGVKAQSKLPLDHSVYDGWQDIGKMDISLTGQYVYYEVKVQKGDGWLYLQTAKGDTTLKVPRGEDGYFSKNNRYFICKIAAPFVDKDKKEKPAKDAAIKQDEQSLDSLLVFDLQTGAVRKFAALKGDYKVAGLQQNVLVWLSELPDSAKSASKSIHAVKDSLDSAKKPLKSALGWSSKDKFPVEKKDIKKDKSKSKSDFGLHVWVLGLKGLDSLKVMSHVKAFDSDTTSDYLAVTALVGHDLDSQSLGVLSIKNGDYAEVLQKAKEIKAVAMTDQSVKGAPARLAFIATGVEAADSQGHHNDIYLWNGAGKAEKIVTYDKVMTYENWGVSPYSKLTFSRSGDRLFFESAPVKADTDSLTDAVSLDIWNTASDVLFTEHQANIDRFNKRGYKAVYMLDQQKLMQLEDSVYSDLVSTYKGDGRYFYLGTDSSRRIAKQWLGYTLKDFYVVDMATGSKTAVLRNLDGRIYPSYDGSRALVYDRAKRAYLYYEATKNSLKPVQGFAYPLYDEQDDHAEAPSNYGVLGWDTVSHAVYVYDRYDIYRIDAKTLKVNLVGKSGRDQKIQTRLYLTRRERSPYYFNGKQMQDFDVYAEDTKNNQFIRFSLDKPAKKEVINGLSNHMALNLINARNNQQNSIYTLENYESSPQVFIRTKSGSQQLSKINRQQANYSWGHAQLFKWKAYTGKQTEGILYLPDNLDTTKKYPMITYFYERRNETLYKYIAPKPTGSALNISFFVSRGYAVFVPDIWYTVGHPGQSAYDYVISGVKAVTAAHPYIDTTRLGMQGQSWGGYQVAYLVTRTNLFKAAWAGAPVVDMFSAYGGIRWKTGSSRAMQYEKGQSRIGATPWENKGLYIENSPLFNIPKIETPLVIMSNDGDGAVPWYQGIEFFMALRRFGKQAWLLNYRGEEHNLVKRPNKLDIQKKEAEYFDWQLKGAPRPSWTY